MIRVNLLPQRRGPRAAPQGSQRWLLITLGVVILEVVLLFWHYQTQVEERDELVRKNNVLQQQINDIRKLVANHEEIKKALVVLRAREDAIAQLQSARSGPTAVLLELAQLLTLGKGPTADADKLAQLRKENPLAVYNPAWDARRLWMTSYIESERTVRIEGLARDGTDVYELAQRLKLSEYFHDVQLLPGKKENAKDKLEVVSFALQLKVRY
ncbi:MAG TPA: PilN domain-containing protein [Candidatus Nanopelagicales bacterium]|nr:PilN domain-containing protein [Candidatus Nanopelagicales bacterium]